MLRNIDLNEVSDGRLYDINDMVKADCNGCKGCSDCCRGMGSSIILDPLDVHRLSAGLSKTFEEMLNTLIEINVVDGVVLPNLKMTASEDSCVFLKNGRCSVHSFRPGFCRLFPLGRLYEERTFHYFLQIHECPAPGKRKVKVQKWLDTPDIKHYEKFIADWHYYLKDVKETADASGHENTAKALSMYVLKQFYLKAFSAEEDFYHEFDIRLKTARQVLLTEFGANITQKAAPSV